MKKKNETSGPTGQAAEQTPKIVVRETHEFLFCNFTQKELGEKSEELARKTLDLETIRSRKSAVQNEYKAKETEVAARLKVLSTEISNRGEDRRTRCEWRLNVPKVGRKTLIRMDTLDVVREDEMSAADSQLTLDDVADKGVEDKLNNVTPAAGDEAGSDEDA